MGAPWQVRLQRMAIVPAQLLKIRLTRVFRCTVGATSECQVASTERWGGANGIAISADRKYVFVNDPAGMSVTVLERLPTGELIKSSVIQTKHILDNIEMTADGGALQAGSIPLPYSYPVVCDEAEALSATKVVGGRSVGCGTSPGGLLKIELKKDKHGAFVPGAQTDHAMHDGSKLSAIAG